MAGSWWDDSGLLRVLQALNPLRLGYLSRALEGIDLRGKKALDVGCGGGLLAEELACLGCAVTGIDPSEPSLEAARTHARSAGLAIEYRRGTGERLPLPDAAFGLVCCCDVLEHVEDLPRVIAEIARVLAPGGLFLYDTINRTVRSRLVMIKLLQDWRWTSFLPPDLHDWNRFIKPGELLPLLARNGLRNRHLTGLKPGIHPLRALTLLRARKRGTISYLEAFQRLQLQESPDLRVLFMGYAEKTSTV